jgi:Flagellar biosynthesis protein, FliO
MWDEIAGAYGSRFLFAAGGVGVALLLLIAVLWLLRNRAPSPFVRGGKNRQQRLQVLDAAAVDARRRLVLVRRDGIEHLIMIGGPTDIVIESGISDATKSGAAAQGGTDTIPAYEASPEPVQMEQPRVDRPAFGQPVAAPPLAAEIYSSPAQRTEPVAIDELASRRAAPPMDRSPRAAPSPHREFQPATPRPPETAQSDDVFDVTTHYDLPQEPVRPTPVRANAGPVSQLARQAAAPAAVSSAPPAVATPPRELGGDFQRVLEAEM